MGQFFHLHVDLTWIFELNATDIKTSLFYVLVVFLFVFFFSFFVPWVVVFLYLLL